MGRKTFLSVGFDFPGDGVEKVDLLSDRSLLDADIVVFRPDKYVFRVSAATSKTESLIWHWRGELRQALEHGKTVIVLLCEGDEKDVLNGVLDSNYSAIPFVDVEFIFKETKSHRPNQNTRVIDQFMKHFQSNFSVHVYLEGQFDLTLLTTKTGGKAIAAIKKYKAGTVVFLPDIDFNTDEFVFENLDTGDMLWTEKAEKYGKLLESTIIEIDNNIRASLERSPAPDWVQETMFILAKEAEIQVRIDKLQTQIDAKRHQIDALSERLNEEGSLRRLLYSTGKELEDTV
ncbi:MAG: hypothetical protein KC547_19220, partial [Anaerolineae bacterium]|nr:hypothetical protein [Anaerolineae bacterium]